MAESDFAHILSTMELVRFARGLTFVIISLILSVAYSLTESAAVLVHYETQANAIAKRSTTPIKIPHFEIPLNLIQYDFAQDLDPKIAATLIFEKNGQKYVRWILNPEDTKWFKQVASYFAAKGIELKKEYYFTGYQTASRSYIVEDPKKTVQFSVKSSTDVTGGRWADKKQPIGEAIDSRLNSEFLKEIQKQKKFDNIVIMDEPAILEIAGIDQAVVIRSLDSLKNKDKEFIYLPGFSALHERIGRYIAKINGSNDPLSYWGKHYIEATGRALGEFAARTGMQFDSPHSQNFLIELDSNYKPTGRIVFRDLADLYVYKDMMNALSRDPKSYFDKFTQKDNVLNHVEAAFGPLHGNKYPSWVTEYDYSKWNHQFFKAFETEFSKISGLRVADFKQYKGVLDGDYFSNTYEVKTDKESTKSFWNKLSESKGSMKESVSCRQLLH